MATGRSRNRTAKAAEIAAQEAAQREAGAAVTDQEQAAPEVTESEQTVTPDAPEVTPDTDATQSDEAVTDVQPEPETTDSEQPETAAAPEPQEPEAQPEQPAQDSPEPEPAVVTDGEQPVTESAPEPQDAEPDAAPVNTEDEQPVTAPEPETPGTPSGYTPPPDPETEPVTSLQPEEVRFEDLLRLAGNVTLGADTRWSALVQAGVKLVQRLASMPEGEGTIEYIPYAIPGANGSGPARMYALAQLLYVFGSDMAGRIITHDNTKTRPGRMRITAYAEVQADVVAFLEAAFPVLDIWGGVARKERRERRARLSETNTYLDNLAERAVLQEQGCKLAQDIARASTVLGLTPEGKALYVHHVQRLKANAAAPLKGERHYLEDWNQPQHLGGYPVPDMFAGVTPALAGASA